MAHPFKAVCDEHTKEIQMQDFYNSLDHHLKGEYRTMQLYKDVFEELRDVSDSLGNYGLSDSLGNTIGTMDKFMYGDDNVKDVINSMPVFNSVLETMILETKFELSDNEGDNLIY